MSQPVKRGPGRPRKHPLPEAKVAEAATGWIAPASTPEMASDAPVDADPRIGHVCDPSWSGVGYSDGSTYRCENGKIAERIR